VVGLNHHVLVLGATGPTGRQIVTQAIEQGHTVTALARRPERLAIRHPRLTTVAGDVAADEQSLAGVLPDHDVIVSALGRGMVLRSEGLIGRSAPRIVSAMEQAGISRLVFLSAYGVGGTAPHAPWVYRFMFRLMLADIYADKAAGEAIITSSALTWTILAPVVLTNGPGTGRYRVAEDLPIRGLARISRADVAACVLRCIDDPASFRKRQVVAR
jgi:putative NADH-flavin reductase